MDIRPRISVLWSDESKFEIFGSNRRVVVLRKVDERLLSACAVPPVRHGGGGVLNHCPVEKQMIVPLSQNQMGWRITAESCGSHAG